MDDHITSIIQGVLPLDLQFVSDTDVGYVCGSAIRFLSITEIFPTGYLIHDDIVFQVPCLKHGFFRTAPNKSIFCYAELHPPIRVFIHHYPDFSAISRIDEVADGELLDIALTYTKLLVTLLGRPENQVKIWSWEDQSIFCIFQLSDIYVPDIRLSLSTWNWRDFCISGEGSLRLFTIDQPVEDDHALAVIIQRPFQLPYSRNSTPKEPIELFQCANTSKPAGFVDLEAVAQVPLNLLQAFVDEVLGRVRLIPTAHSWHVDGGLYIGTNEGSLLYFHPHRLNSLPTYLGLDVPLLAVKQLVSSRDGLAFTNSLNEFRVISMASPTEIQDVVIPMKEENVQYLWQSPRNDPWIALTDRARLVSFNPGEAKVTQLCSRKDFSRFMFIGKFFGGCLYSLQEMGILKIWNDRDEPEFTYQLSFDATSIDASPNNDFLAIGSRNGYIHILDCTYCHNGQQPRLLCSHRVFSSRITKIRFDLSGTIILMAAQTPSYKIVILSALVTKKWKILGVIRLPGALTEFHALSDCEGNIFVAAGVATNEDPTVAMELITFRISPALCEDPAPFYGNVLDEFTDACILLKRLEMKVPFRTFAVESHNSIFFATTTKHLVHAKSETWTRTPAFIAGTTSLKFPIAHVIFLPEIEHLLLVDTHGSFSVRFIEFFTEIAKDEISLGDVKEVAWKQNKQGFHVYYVMQDGKLVCRTTPFIPELELEERVSVVGNMAAEFELMKDLRTKEPDLVGRYDPNGEIVIEEDTNQEAWMSMKSRICSEQIQAAQNSQASDLKARFSTVKTQLLQLYEKNVPLNGLKRLRDDYFELLDDGWLKLRKRRENEICESQTGAHLELIEHRLMKEKLIRRYSSRLSIQHQSIYGLGSKLKLSNFPIPKRSAAVQATTNRVAFQRSLEQDFEKKTLNIPTDNLHDRSAADDASLSASRDYTTQIMINLCDKNTSKAKIFNDLYFEDVLTSRVQRVHQIALLRECSLLLKEEFNRQFCELLRRKASVVEALQKKMDIIQRQMQSAKEQDLTLPSPDLLVRNDEDPQKVMYEVAEDQLLEYLKREKLPVPLCFNCNDRNYGLNAGNRSGTLVRLSPSSHRHGIAASRVQVHSPVNDRHKSTNDLIHDCDALIRDFDAELGELICLRDKAVFAAGVIDLRAMHLRQRLLYAEELATYSGNVAFQAQKLVARLQANKVNVTRARKVFDIVQHDYDQLVHNDAALDHNVKKELYEVSDLDGRMLVQIYRKRPHPLRGLKQVKHYKGQELRPRTSELKEQITDEFFNTVAKIEDTRNRPEEIDLKTWVKFCELRRKKMESEMAFWIKHVELELYHGVLKDYLAIEKTLKHQLEEINRQAALTEINQKNLERNSDFVLTLTHGQMETECKPFIDYNDRVILIPLSIIENRNNELQTECQKKMGMLNEVVKYREGITLLKWEKDVHKQKIRDYNHERQFINSQSAPLEFRKMVGKDFGEYREEKYQQLKQSLKQQKKIFKDDIQVWGNKVRLLQQKLMAFQHERYNAEASMRGLMIELQERHTVGESIGIHADASESEMRQALVLKRLRIQTIVNEQKKRMEALRQSLWKWQQKTFPAIYRDIRNF
ncbi:hypothetical protein BV898_00378 [Hypsibius exemplaris]|uniref:Cilia- and flagella-associated protein 43 n=1 Tax=Hypsibius exemplaris TaxID=2072580 RepID=A0A1W0XFK4_HYPEX|nr:hypothetical protein BV898_00378 [Hypsibius exemplaris]